MEIDESLSVIVTGGTSGLGQAAIRALRKAGAEVSLFARNRAEGEKVAAETGSTLCVCDVTSDDSVTGAFARAREINGQERVLICCAGGANAMRTASRDKATGEARIFPSEEFERVLNLNALGTFRCITRAAAGMMNLEPVDGERGVLINTSSLAATEGQIGQVAYAAGKAAINGMTLTIARDLAREAIRCNTIQPGLFNTPAMRRAPEAFLEAMGRRAPFPNRLGEPEEYARLAMDLIRNPYMNGEIIRLDGALRMEPR